MRGITFTKRFLNSLSLTSPIDFSNVSMLYYPPDTINKYQESLIEDINKYNHLKVVKRHCIGFTTMLFGYGIFLTHNRINCLFVSQTNEAAWQAEHLFVRDGIMIPKSISISQLESVVKSEPKFDVVLCDEVGHYSPDDMDILRRVENQCYTICVTSVEPPMEFMFGHKIQHYGYVVTEGV